MFAATFKTESAAGSVTIASGSDTVISPADHSWPGPFFLSFAVLGSMSSTPDIKFIEMISIEDGPACGRVAEEAAQVIKEGTLSRAAVKRENEAVSKQTSSGSATKKLKLDGVAPAPAPVISSRQQALTDANALQESHQILAEYKLRLQYGAAEDRPALLLQMSAEIRTQKEKRVQALAHPAPAAAAASAPAPSGSAASASAPSGSAAPGVSSASTSSASMPAASPSGPPGLPSSPDPPHSLSEPGSPVCSGMCVVCGKETQVYETCKMRLCLKMVHAVCASLGKFCSAPEDH